MATIYNEAWVSKSALRQTGIDLFAEVGPVLARSIEEFGGSSGPVMVVSPAEKRGPMKGMHRCIVVGEKEE